MMQLGFGLGLTMQQSGGGGGVAPIISGQAYDEPTNTITASVNQAGCTPYWLFNQSATPLAGPFVVANATGSDDPTSLGTNYYDAVDTGLPSGTNYLHLTVVNGSGQIAEPVVVPFAVYAPVMVSEIRATTGYGSSFILAVGPSTSRDEILICAQHTGTNVMSSANFDLIHTAKRGGSRYSILRWNGTGTRPNGSNVTVTGSGSDNISLASFVVADAIITATSFADNLGPGVSITTGTLTSSRGLLFALFSANDDAAGYSIASPAGIPTLTPPVSTDFSDGQVSVVRNVSFGFQAAGIQHIGPTTPAITLTTSSSGDTAAVVLLALEARP